MNHKNMFNLLPPEILENILSWCKERDFQAICCTEKSLLLGTKEYFFTCVMNIDLFQPHVTKYIQYIASASSIYKYNLFRRLCDFTNHNRKYSSIYEEIHHLTSSISHDDVLMKINDEITKILDFFQKEDEHKRKLPQDNIEKYLVTFNLLLILDGSANIRYST